MTRVLLLLVMGSLVMGGCAGSRKARKADTAGKNTGTENINLADYEDFDAAPYTDRPEPEAVEIDHDVPATLMKPSASAPARRTARGYRLQVFSTPDKQAADAQVSAISQWWQSQKGSKVPGLFQGSTPPIYTIYRQPYYRIRIGNFTSRQQAQQALSAVASRFPGAMIVQDTVAR